MCHSWVLSPWLLYYISTAQWFCGVCYNCTFMVTMCLLQAERCRSATSQTLVMEKVFILDQLLGQETSHHAEKWVLPPKTRKGSIWQILAVKFEEKPQDVYFIVTKITNSADLLKHKTPKRRHKEHAIGL